MVGINRIADMEIGPTDPDDIIDNAMRDRLGRMGREESDIRLADLSMANRASSGEQ